MIKIIVRSKLKRVTYIENNCIIPGDNSINFEDILDKDGKIKRTAKEALDYFKNSHYLASINSVVPGQIEIINNESDNIEPNIDINLFKDEVELPKNKKKK
jgi:hypothetical protein